MLAQTYSKRSLVITTVYKLEMTFVSNMTNILSNCLLLYVRLI